MAPTFDFAMVALNKKSSKWSRFYVKGSGFTSSTKVLIDNKECHKVTPMASGTVLSVAVKYADIMTVAAPAGPGMATAAGTATGEVDLTITVKDGPNAVDKLVTVLVVDEVE